ncbi:PhzF family phenazine biosynthesis protein [Candidatus Roizmanbacteria bacterium CG03_land_8_20_14_0_80_36_21]|uniref:PhzF family phenazine biosynthesis protein n=2 Tax=Candidatus Roizmaniibacteriota TaxID=1752723 RepID=A0A2M8KLB3_9BACT|nr:MAG: PhzF family phenazine biosynthesis protein [Candidatus Roizmanbacteria bacterium CG03_land_8_20_14_0_80_36_21]PJC81356.1 MAG: PhzF family phenazine biosynthesis protein [Candidatus Roizmanbacteria bacterium CG_4_8_14_3_um_filter_36_10]PJE60719.1 MAG: PhzF family phenazine biosynthesis protein [Candidatus Roizmanbacteria bacterium CG10_big_fil_rev_8_21_14_0_10_36_26]
MKIKVYLLSAFGVSKNGGNPAGVVLNADSLTDNQKKAISKIVNYSETAFISSSDKADFKVTFFTPKDEVDLCGHATIATYSLLYQKHLFKSGVYKQELKSAILPIEIRNDGLILMDQPLPTFSEEVSVDEIMNIFNISKNIILRTHLKPQIVSTGLRDILLPIIDRKALFDLKPDFKKMSKLNKKTNSVGFHAFTFDTINNNSLAHCRNFAPLYGIKEEAATGSSSGALACFLFKNKMIKNHDLNKLVFEQGYSMDKPSEINVLLEAKNNNIITRVRVGGKAILFGEKILEI